MREQMRAGLGGGLLAVCILVFVNGSDAWLIKACMCVHVCACVRSEALHATTACREYLCAQCTVQPTHRPFAGPRLLCTPSSVPRAWREVVGGEGGG